MQQKGQPASSASAVLARQALNLPISTRPRRKLLASGMQTSVNLHPWYGYDEGMLGEDSTNFYCFRRHANC